MRKRQVWGRKMRKNENEYIYNKKKIKTEVKYLFKEENYYKLLIYTI